MIIADDRETSKNRVGTSRVAVAAGDGIGPEIMAATLKVLAAIGADLEIVPIEIGEKVYARGESSGIGAKAWEEILKSDAVLKAPITTPQGGGVKSINVTLRKSLGLFANVRPCRAYAPFVASNHPAMDVVIVRENEEDLYAGIEHRQTHEVYQCLKLMSVTGCERIVRYAFEYTRAHGRKKVTCMTKDNIMKLTDGLFHRVFDEVAKEYPELVTEHMIVDIGAARLATRPESFDVVVAPNLYGDILSDIAAEVAGSIGMAPSANIGITQAVFEAIHGSAPDIAGLNVANPSALLLSAAMMLAHLGKTDEAQRVQNAWLKTIEDGIHTQDMAGEKTRQIVGTAEFADAVIERLGGAPQKLPAMPAASERIHVLTKSLPSTAKKEIVGVDIFVEWKGDVDSLAQSLARCGWEGLALQMITNRGVKVWPQGLPQTLLTDHWRCRFKSEHPMDSPSVATLISIICGLGHDVIKTETLCNFGGQPGYSLGQGQ